MAFFQEHFVIMPAFHNFKYQFKKKKKKFESEVYATFHIT